MNIDKIAYQLESVDGVERCRIWSKNGVGHERIYIDLPRLNGGKHWNGDSAGTVYYDAFTQAIIIFENWAGAATRNRAKEVLALITEELGFEVVLKKDLGKLERKIRYERETA